MKITNRRFDMRGDIGESLLRSFLCPFALAFGMRIWEADSVRAVSGSHVRHAALFGGTPSANF